MFDNLRCPLARLERGTHHALEIAEIAEQLEFDRIEFPGLVRPAVLFEFGDPLRVTGLRLGDQAAFAIVFDMVGDLPIAQVLPQVAHHVGVEEFEW